MASSTSGALKLLIPSGSPKEVDNFVRNYLREKNPKILSANIREDLLQMWEGSKTPEDQKDPASLIKKANEFIKIIDFTHDVMAIRSTYLASKKRKVRIKTGPGKTSHMALEKDEKLLAMEVSLLNFLAEVNHSGKIPPLADWYAQVKPSMDLIIQSTQKSHSRLANVVSYALVHNPAYEEIVNASSSYSELERYAFLAYFIWAQTLKHPEDAMHREFGRGLGKVTWPIGYIPKKEFKADTSESKEIFYTLDPGIIERIKSPIQEDKDHKMAHVWGYTGLPSDSKLIDGRIDPSDLKHASLSHMATVTLDTSGIKPKLVISFRGSRGGDIDLGSMLKVAGGYSQSEMGGKKSFNPDWVTDLNRGPSFDLVRGDRSPDQIALHAGIQKAYLTCRAGLAEGINSLGIKDLKSFEGDIYVTGHSLGGGLATMCAYDLRGGMSSQENYPELVADEKQSLNCTTFSAPAVGNKKFVEDFDQRVPKCTRILISNDPVPIQAAGLRHVGRSFEVDQVLNHFETKGAQFGRKKEEKYGSLPDGNAHELANVGRLVKMYECAMKRKEFEDKDYKPLLQYRIKDKTATPDTAPLYLLDDKDIPRTFLSTALKFDNGFTRRVKNELWGLRSLLLEDKGETISDPRRYMSMCLSSLTKLDQHTRDLDSKNSTDLGPYEAEMKQLTASLEALYLSLQPKSTTKSIKQSVYQSLSGVRLLPTKLYSKPALVEQRSTEFIRAIIVSTKEQMRLMEETLKQQQGIEIESSTLKLIS